MNKKIFSFLLFVLISFPIYAINVSYPIGTGGGSMTSNYSLDSDKLDGEHGAFYQDASNINTGELSILRLPNTVVTNNYSELTVSTLNAGFVTTNRLVIKDQDLESIDVTFETDTTKGLRLTNPRGWISLTPLNSGWAHIYSDRSRFIFNKPIYSYVNEFSAYNNDLKLSRIGKVKATIGIETSTFNTNIVSTGSVEAVSFSGDGSLLTNISAESALTANNSLLWNGQNSEITSVAGNQRLIYDKTSEKWINEFPYYLKNSVISTWNTYLDTNGKMTINNGYLGGYDLSIGHGGRMLLTSDRHGYMLWTYGGLSASVDQDWNIYTESTRYNISLTSRGGNIYLGQCGIGGAYPATTNILQGAVLAPAGQLVGIGTFSPKYNLDVSGNARITGTLIANIDGTISTANYADIANTANNYVETDPVYSGDPAFGITNTDISNWNDAYATTNQITATDLVNWDSAYSWGNHALAGYALTSTLNNYVLTSATANWNTAYTDRLKWDGGATGLVVATGRASLGLLSMALQPSNNVNISGGIINATSITANILKSTGSFATNRTYITSNLSLTDQHSMIECNNAVSLTVRPPQASTCAGRIYYIKNISSTGTVVIDPYVAELIEGSSTYTLPKQYHSVAIQSNGTGWNILADKNYLLDQDLLTNSNAVFSNLNVINTITSNLVNTSKLKISGGVVTLNNAISNWIEWDNVGKSSPSDTSLGWKIRTKISDTGANCGVGMNSDNSLWYVASTTGGHVFYADNGTTYTKLSTLDLNGFNLEQSGDFFRCEEQNLLGYSDSKAQIPLDLNVTGLASATNGLFSDTVTANYFDGDGSKLININALTSTTANFANVANTANNYVETDPVYSGDPAFGITNTDITNWNDAYATTNQITATDLVNWDSAYSWGNHALAGYALTSTLNNYVLASATIVTNNYFGGTITINSGTKQIGFLTNLDGNGTTAYFNDDDFLTAIGLESYCGLAVTQKNGLKNQVIISSISDALIVSGNSIFDDAQFSNNVDISNYLKIGAANKRIEIRPEATSAYLYFGDSVTYNENMAFGYSGTINLLDTKANTFRIESTAKPNILNVDSTTGYVSIGGIIGSDSLTVSGNVAASGIVCGEFTLAGGADGYVLKSDAFGQGTWQANSSVDLSANNTFTGKNIFTKVILNYVLVDASFSLNEVHTVTEVQDGSYGSLMIRENGIDYALGHWDIYYNGSGIQFIQIANTGIFSTTKDTASKINLYFEGGYLQVQNKIGNARNIRVSFIGIDD